MTAKIGKKTSQVFPVQFNREQTTCHKTEDIKPRPEELLMLTRKVDTDTDSPGVSTGTNCGRNVEPPQNKNALEDITGIQQYCNTGVNKNNTSGHKEESNCVQKQDTKSTSHKETVVAVKRRPGRPPGSTKKAKQAAVESEPKPLLPIQPHYNMHFMEEFSLRRFFEAGGRNYKDYIELSKRVRPSNAQEKMPLTSQMSPPPYTGSGVVSAPVPPTQHETMQYSNLKKYKSESDALPIICKTTNDYPQLRHSLSPPTYNHAISTKEHNILNITPQVCTSEPQYQCYDNPNISKENHLQHMDYNHPTTNDVMDYTTTNSRSNQSDQQTSQPEVLDLSSKKRKSDESAYQRSSENKCLKRDYDDTRPEVSSRLHQRKLSHDGFESVDERISNLIPAEKSKDDKPVNVFQSWDVQQVSHFVSSIPECSEYASAFVEHRIDGVLLPRLSEQHLMSVMGMKLGPALRLLIEVSRQQHNT